MLASEKKRINLFWLILAALTLLAIFVAEAATPGHFITLVICLTISIKGRLVIDEFMGLREAKPIIRYTIHSYFILLPIFIYLCIIFPEILAQLTTIK
ncbi:MAG: cytochrome C oxidase subunit IV family protein [gamma proteobacterium symbiont of Bathyaustriella thionipta]|nr:cytochrome C oxidase subunit IV family protein [gamma proteobacterium symbiont of Bathyaustriella thionipta]MCU7951686.1 cytochrome C oxidase subunit IV family protein [gamma proteobacterium symbiont of Bathyaustriella thionipta]MCU7952279.1 cytochrome C oxidase subunit IV family protein [gamma proteobacterium symbiont of Bathyaustriella thionipta]MCU7958283.1 cytochrome C oxidase subunit IV family protein [gamma proteobacterium symbiont of Bathyaustriella thionipta]MCU7967554.1 cytochrome C